ncbi:MAG TPA: cyclopropane-fatty-acyl-phospholipid synthase family protein [Mycobacteriales bacterium]|nr:cyclopropane-fatty-acyl-phospholipid synthase family protein [Mycobacteriales bacterium]
MTITARPVPVASRLLSLVQGSLHTEVPVRLRAWDGSTAGPPEATTTVVVRSPDALRRMMWAPGELGVARAYVVGDLDVEGDLLETVAGLVDVLVAFHRRVGLRDAVRVLREMTALHGVGRPLPPPATEAQLTGWRHSLRRDAAAIAHHYEVSSDFYRLFLGETMAYSCGYWPDGVRTLDEAQAAKFDLVCRKLDLRPGMRVLDVGCGWGGFVRHAAREHGVRAVGVTISPSQVSEARQRIAAAGLAERVEIREQDYREVADGPYDAVVSIGMAEHVGTAKLGEYAAGLYRLLRPRGRVLHHAIACREGEPQPRPTFMSRYIFPDGELQPVGLTVRALEGAGLEVRDVHALREHYALTLRAWLRGLEERWADAERLVGAERARVWRLYLAVSSVAFVRNGVGVNQVLAVRPDQLGGAGMPAVRPT